MTSRGVVGTALAAVLVAFTGSLAFVGFLAFTGSLAFVGPVFADGTARAPDRSAPSSSARAETAASPAPDDDLVAKVRTAFTNHDLDFFENHLVDWDGARKRTRRLTLMQIRECFGRPIKSAGLEPLKPDPAAPLVPEGYRTNRPVTHLLRVVFDEQHVPEETPSCVFMLSKDPKTSYRMVLVLPTAPPPN